MEPLDGGNKTKISAVAEIEIHGLMRLISPYLSHSAKRDQSKEMERIKRAIESQGNSPTEIAQPIVWPDLLTLRSYLSHRDSPTSALLLFHPELRLLQARGIGRAVPAICNCCAYCRLFYFLVQNESWISGWNVYNRPYTKARFCAHFLICNIVTAPAGPVEKSAKTFAGSGQ